VGCRCQRARAAVRCCLTRDGSTARPEPDKGVAIEVGDKVLVVADIGSATGRSLSCHLGELGAEVVGLAEPEIGAILGELSRTEQVQRRGGARPELAAAEAGRLATAHAAAEELECLGTSSDLHRAYEEFATVNATLKQTMHRLAAAR
jgi:hypothetical protein